MPILYACEGIYQTPEGVEAECRIIAEAIFLRDGNGILRPVPPGGWRFKEAPTLVSVTRLTLLCPMCGVRHDRQQLAKERKFTVLDGGKGTEE